MPYNTRKERMVMTGLGIGLAALTNLASKRPLISRIWIYPIYGLGGYGLGHLFGQWNIKRLTEKDLAIWDYVKRHPEDFPELSPKKYKEVLDSWHPVR